MWEQDQRRGCLLERAPTGPNNQLRYGMGQETSRSSSLASCTPAHTSHALLPTSQVFLTTPSPVALPAAWLSGNLALTEDVLTYLTLVGPCTDKDDCEELNGRLSTLLGQFKLGLDFYGTPKNWSVGVGGCGK